MDLSQLNNEPKPVTVSLVLGSGGARGYAHIGVIDELVDRGYQIKCISGCSMGALVGGLYAAGKLEEYREWINSLDYIDVIRLLDVSFNLGGIRGNKVFEVINGMLESIRIEDLPIPYTAVATDLVAQQEIWFQRGLLQDAIRASIAIPSIFTPVIKGNRFLVDGGVLNPLPIAPTISAHTDIIIAVDLSSNKPDHELPDNNKSKKSLSKSKNRGPFDRWFGQLRKRTQSLFENGNKKDDFSSIINETGDNVLKKGMMEIINQSLETMQSSLAQYKIAGYPPDVLIGISRNACRFYEFYRSQELIDLGRIAAKNALDRFEGIETIPKHQGPVVINDDSEDVAL
ncbi:patatin-like phospholipase family protein [Zooshikella harenae]|uniref:Patatin-like phospholipase family protein n=1 Tax=Zooshikella harenae TaxID=2827238 RepID=A0ABS5ZD01_9GAMM|nr:patatin-like phospholipase family protein [Zooshikella harenae]MBU2711633.1 patatin-like phospholipase family protein [Zooshikella harenae]